MAFSFDSYFDSPFGTPTDSEQARALLDVLGRDVFFNGRMVVAAKGDYTTVEGIENYRRAVLRMLMTTPGTYRLRPTYGAGCLESVKKKATKGTIDALTTRIRAQLGTDRRTQKVLTVQVTPLTGPGQQGLKVYIVVQAFGRTLKPLSYSFTREA